MSRFSLRNHVGMGSSEHCLFLADKMMLFISSSLVLVNDDMTALGGETRGNVGEILLRFLSKCSLIFLIFSEKADANVLARSAEDLWSGSWLVHVLLRSLFI